MIRENHSYPLLRGALALTPRRTGYPPTTYPPSLMYQRNAGVKGRGNHFPILDALVDENTSLHKAMMQ